MREMAMSTRCCPRDAGTFGTGHDAWGVLFGVGGVVVWGQAWDGGVGFGVLLGVEVFGVGVWDLGSEFGVWRLGFRFGVKGVRFVV